MGEEEKKYCILIKLDYLVATLLMFFQATFEQVLSKLATTNLKMATHEYKALRESETLENTMAFLQQRAADGNIPIYDIALLKDSLRHDNTMSSLKHREWKPPQVRVCHTLGDFHFKLPNPFHATDMESKAKMILGPVVQSPIKLLLD